MNTLEYLLNKKDLSHDEMRQTMQRIMSGQETPTQIAAFLVALRAKGETVTEITAATEVMRELVTPVELAEIDLDRLVDTCGTGGDGAHTFNVSTTCALVAAAAGAKIAKHGGRSVSSKSGSADILEALGVKIDFAPEHVATSIRTIGIGFMFAPNHHPAMKYAAPVRRELGIRTLFNLLGPVTNPARAKNQVLGVFSDKWVRPMAEVLAALGSHHVLVVHGHDGLDEISISDSTRVAELKNGQVQEYTLSPEEFGFQRAPLSTIKVASIEESKDVILRVLNNQPSPARDIVCLNAGAAIYVAGLSDSLKEGIEIAKSTLASGRAYEKLCELTDYALPN